MNTADQTRQKVAEDAIFQVQVAVSALTKARHLFAAIKPLTEPHSSAHELIELGEMFVMEYEFDGNAEAKKLEAALEVLTQCAPQTVDMPNRGAELHSLSRISLAEFAKGRQHAAARDLGVEQGAISKAIRVKREIYVTRHVDGSLSALEEKPFPSRLRAEAVQ